MVDILERLHAIVWGAPALILIIFIGICVCVKTGFCQLTLFPDALRRFGSSICAASSGGRTSGYRALCTALAATVGTGNIAGVAGAICLGGPGALFWIKAIVESGMVDQCT